MISIVVPVLHEAGNINPLIEKRHEALAPRFDNYEIVYVNDGSSDGKAMVSVLVAL